jgi:hypothetical protein
MANAGNSIGAHPGSAQHGAKGTGTTKPGEKLDEFDLADEMKGDNALQGEDQQRHVSDREAQPGAHGDTEELKESIRKADKHERAAAQNRSRKH